MQKGSSQVISSQKIMLVSLSLLYKIKTPTYRYIYTAQCPSTVAQFQRFQVATFEEIGCAPNLGLKQQSRSADSTAYKGPGSPMSQVSQTEV